MSKILLNGSKILIERIKFEEKTNSGLILPTHIANDKEEVGTTKALDPYQMRGTILEIGISCSETFKEHFKIGDIVHFDTRSFDPVSMDKTDRAYDSTQYGLLDEYSVHWKEIN